MMPSPVRELEPQVFVVSESERGLRLDRFLGRRIPRMSRSSVQEAITERVTISSGACPKPSRQVYPGEVVTISPRPIPAAVLARSRPALLHESPGWVVVDKPAGLSTTPSAARPGDDLATLTGLHPAHRLDRFTSGCVALTWTRDAACHFERVFRERLAHKEYLAVVRGVPGQARFTVDAELVPDPQSRVPDKVRCAPRGSGGQDAVTHVEVLAASPAGAAALVKALPRTGRKHQVRAHLAHAGWPIVGDLLHGGDERDFVRFQLGHAVRTPDGLAPGRHLLHAAALTVPDLDGRDVACRAPLPADFPPWARTAT